MLQALLKDPIDEAQAHATTQSGALARARLGFVSGIKLLVNPEDTNQVFYLARALGPGNLPRILERLKQSEAGRALLERRPAIDRVAVDFDALRRLPADTLGGAYARMLDQNGLTPDLFQRPPGLPDDLAWMVQRMRQTHDLWHVLTGLRTDVSGEISLQAFMSAQLGLSLSTVLTVVGVVFFGPTHPRLFGRVRRWYAQGRRASFLLEVAWEDRWSEPLAKLRRDVGIDPPEPDAR